MVNVTVNHAVMLSPGGGGGVVGRKIDTYVRPAPEKIDQVRLIFFMKKEGRPGGKI